MPEPFIKCPKCGAEFTLTDSAVAPVRESERRRYEALLEEQRWRVASETEEKARKASEEALSAKDAELAAAKEQLETKERKLAEAQRDQAEALKLKTSLEERQRELDLRIQKGIQEGIEAARENARKDAEEALSMSIRERDLLIGSLRTQIDEMKKRAEQGSQQAQGEAQELALEEALTAEFPFDLVEPVEKGVRGADCIQRVRSETGQIAGSILWESKRTKNWSGDWLPKLKADQRACSADIAILATQAMPRAGEELMFQDGIWICTFALAVPLARALRPLLVEIARSRQVTSGQRTKTEMIYAYLTGSQFRARVEAIVEAFRSMQNELQAEKRTMTKLWAKREKELEKVLEATSGMYGDLQGIAGSSIPELEGFDLAQLTDGGTDADE